ncbi:thymidylate synthase [Bacillus sp. FJAT-27264]|uniref:thymidylate synthase n=1 Tax=Paenibacillus sp. (strain DSM 101736 / FJAT-27264) TaxID=1850362 RepID=UPI0009F2291D
MMIFKNVNEAFTYYIKQLQSASESKPRGMRIKECLGVSFSVENPRDRITNNTSRQMSLSFAFGEFLWYLRGSDKLDIIEYYSKMYPNFSDDKVSVNGAYGARIFGGELSQWEQVKNILSRDPDSRQAVISIYQPRDLFSCSLDIPCTCVLQYFIRDGKLNGITYMRSNDIYLGMPYDIFSFTMLQEILALELNVDLGSYTHMVGSLHIYEKHFDIFNSLSEIENQTDQSMLSMTKEAVTSEQMALILQAEQALRKNEVIGDINLDPYWKPFIDVLRNKSKQVQNWNKRDII